MQTKLLCPHFLVGSYSDNFPDGLETSGLKHTPTDLTTVNFSVLH